MERRRTQIHTGSESLVKQADADSYEINGILRRYRATGEMEHEIPLGGAYGDFSEAADYHTQMNRVRSVEEHFMRLPAEVRAACKNDPGEMLDIATNPNRTGELERLNEILGVPASVAPSEASPSPGPAEAPDETPGILADSKSDEGAIS